MAMSALRKAHDWLKSGVRRAVPPAAPVERQFQHRLTDAEIAEVARKYRAGKTVYDLADEFNAHRTTVASALRGAGVKIRMDSMTDAEIDEAVRLYESGLSLARVGEKVGATGRTVQLRLRERGVKIRGPHDRPTYIEER